MDPTLEQARTFFLEGVACYEQGRLAQAEQKFAAALSLAPARASVLTNLGAVRLKLGRPEEALELLQQALQQEPGNAETLGQCATALAELGRPDEALPLFERALATHPGAAGLWLLRGTALRELGRPAEAASSYREALARGGDAELLNYYLAGLEGTEAPPQPPRDYVQALFDAYSCEFDQHLQSLGYDAPQVLMQRLAAAGRRFERALDLGCGTGWCGPLMRPVAGHLTGVDLSAAMLQKAAATHCYDALQQADIADFLQKASARYDLVLAADVFVYVGQLDPVFALLAQRMPAGGVCAFTVEESRGEPLVLRPSLRYAHSEGELRRLAGAHGFRITTLERRTVRHDQQQPIAGLFAWMEKA